MDAYRLILHSSCTPETCLRLRVFYNIRIIFAAVDEVVIFNLLLKIRLPFIFQDGYFDYYRGEDVHDSDDLAPRTAIIALRKAIKDFKINQPEDAKSSLMKAATNSIRFFYEFAVIAINNPAQYGLSRNDIPHLLDVMHEAVFIEHTIIERENIYQLLSQSSDSRLQTLASAFQPATIQPIFFVDRLQR